MDETVILRVGTLAKQLNTSKKKIIENAVEVEPTLLFLSQFQTVPVDQGVVNEAAGLHRQWNPSHGLDIYDAILVATVMRTGGASDCLNKMHYPMPDLLVKKAW